MKKLLIISPYFPPVNAADMHRVRTSLPYFAANGWEAEIVTVDPKFSDFPQDVFLAQNLPQNLIVHQVSAFSKKWTSKMGLGSIALRSIYFYRKYVDQLLKKQHFDLIYFSTTQFPLLILGAHWKKKFNIPYVIDMQDPWHSTYYEDKPKHERPPKYWFSYRLNKYLEPIAMKKVDGLISVSEDYLNVLRKRYQRLNKIPSKTITFAAFKPDFDFVNQNQKLFSLAFQKDPNLINIVYVGRGGHDMHTAAHLLFTALAKGLNSDPTNFKKIRFHFIGTSYATQGQGQATIKPIADEMGIGEYVNEQSNRIPYYEAINSLIQADALIILGSDDSSYTASKLYPFILADQPLLAILHPKSSATEIIKHCEAGKVVSLAAVDLAIHEIYCELLNFVTKKQIYATNWLAFKTYDASNMVKLQCELFNKVVI